MSTYWVVKYERQLTARVSVGWLRVHCDPFHVNSSEVVDEDQRHLATRFTDVSLARMWALTCSDFRVVRVKRAKGRKRP